MASDPACPANSPRSWPAVSAGDYISLRNAQHAVVVRMPGIRSVVRRPTLVLASDCIARTARPDGRTNGATPGWPPRWIVMDDLMMQRGGCWWPLGLSVPCILCCGHEWPAGKTVWTLLRNGRRSGRMGASGLPWDTASAGGGDGSLFFSIVCANSVDSSVEGGGAWSPAVPAYQHRGGRRPRLCACPSTAPVGPRRADTHRPSSVRTAHHGSLRLGVCMTIVLRSKRNNGCFRLPIPSNESRHRTRRGPQNLKGEEEKLANPTTVQIQPGW